MSRKGRRVAKKAQGHPLSGAALVGLGRLDEAIAAFAQAVAAEPANPGARNNLGAALLKNGRLDEAIAAFRQASRLAPGYPEIHTNLGAALLRQGRLEEAQSAFQQAIALNPGLAEARNNLGVAFLRQGRLAEAMGHIENAVKLRPDDFGFARNLMSCVMYRDDLDNETLKKLHLHLGSRFARPIADLPVHGSRPDRRLRIGYLSSDLRGHPVAANLLPVLRHHDRSAFALHFYAHVKKPDGMTDQFRALADGWCDITGLSDAEVAERIRADGIDILVSLAGRFDDNRPLVCAHRAAPVQISMHDVATSGLDQMDYIIADRWLAPRGTTEFFAERPLRLPNFTVADVPDDIPELAETRPPGPPVFGCFNNPLKITPSVLRLWGRILAGLPSSTLILKFLDHYRSEELCRSFLAVLTQAGAAAEQVRFLTGRDALPDLLARYNSIDVALDTFPFSGSTTTFQALCMGVPVVTRPWDRMVSRWTESMLRTLGLGQLVAASDDEYVAIAVALAGNADRWRQSRGEIRQALAASALCDGARWARHIERFYKAAWRRYDMLRNGRADGRTNEKGLFSSRRHPAGVRREAAESFPAGGDAGATGSAARQVGTPQQEVDLANTISRSAQRLNGASRRTAELIAMAGAAHGAGRLAQAIAAYREVLALQPDFAEVYANLGAALTAAGRPEDAVAACRQAVILKPDVTESLINLGTAYLEQGQRDQAVAAFRRALALDPHHPLAHCNSGRALTELGAFDQAVLACRRAVALDPGSPEAHANLSVSLLELGRFDEAVVAGRRAIALAPDEPQCHANLVTTLMRQGSFAEALTAARRALALHPGHAKASRELAICLLLAGSGETPWAEGLAIYEDRWDDTNRREFPQPRWMGQDLKGRRLLVWGEQGVGDELVHFGFLPELLAQGARCVIECDPRLVPLLRRSFPGVEVVTRMDPRCRAPDIDFQVPAASLVRLLRPRRRDFRPLAPYLRADQAVVAELRRNYGAADALVVGLSWWGRQYAVPLDEWHPLFAVPGVRFVSLQYGDRRTDIGRLRATGRDLAVDETVDSLADFDRFTAQVAAMDLVITIDNSTACVAAGLGRPVWDLLTVVPGDWKKGLDGEDSPWHPTLRLYRQRKHGAWAEMMERVAADLARVLATAMHTQGRLEEAVAGYRALVERRPDSPGIYCNLGAALKDLGRLGQAVAAYRRAIALAPDLAEAHCNLGGALMEQGHCTPAIAACRRSIVLNPGLPAIYANLGIALAALGQFDDAVAACRQAVALAPDDAQAYSNLGNALGRQGLLGQALAAHRRACVVVSDLAEIHSNLGNVLMGLGRLDEAMRAYRQAVILRPEYCPAYSNLGAPLFETGRLDQAIAVQRRAVVLDPAYPEARNNLAIALMGQAQPGAAAECYAAAIRLRPDEPRFFLNLLLGALYRDDLTNESLAELHKSFGRGFAQPVSPHLAHDPRPDRRLRIGFLSSDLRDHPVATNLLPVLCHHDRSAVSLHFYAHLRKPDSATERFRALADGWRDINGLSDAQVAEQIRADRIDILVSLAGRFDANRPAVCAHRAAPVQISMHDVATSGLEQMDYIIADRWLAPRGGTEFFTERPLRLPQFYVADFPDDLPEPAEARPPGQAPVFGCFNNPAKITPSALRLWGRILAARPGSVLILKYMYRYRSEDLRRRFMDSLAAGGAASGQVMFLTEKESRRDFLARYNDIDVALDTFPFSGSTTSFQALSMGVPIITWPWDRMVGRWTESMLRTLGLPELVAASADEYVAIALTVAANAGAWRGRRGEIRERLAGSALCDGARWARHVERLYRAVWRKHCGAAA